MQNSFPLHLLFEISSSYFSLIVSNESRSTEPTVPALLFGAAIFESFLLKTQLLFVLKNWNIHYILLSLVVTNHTVFWIIEKRNDCLFTKVFWRLSISASVSCRLSFFFRRVRIFSFVKRFQEVHGPLGVVSADNEWFVVVWKKTIIVSTSLSINIQDTVLKKTFVFYLQYESIFNSFLTKKK